MPKIYQSYGRMKINVVKAIIADVMNILYFPTTATRFDLSKKNHLFAHPIYMIYYIIFVSLEINRFNIHFEIALHNMSSIERYSMAFMMLSNLSVGAGTENVVAEYCRYAPSNVDITIVQTDKPSGKKTYDFLREMPNVHVKTVRGYDWKLSFLQKNSLTTAILYSMLLPVVFFLLKYTVYRNIWAEIGKPRYVYVFNNFYGSLFPEGPVVIGTTHGWNPELGKFYRGQTLDLAT